MIITDQDLERERKKYMVYAKFWLINPVSWVYMLAIANLLPYQAECMQSVVNNKRTIVRSGHGAGKTFIMAVTACWWLCHHWLRGEGCSVVVTSPSSGNLTTVFWPQFAKCMDLMPKYLQMHFQINADSAFCTEDHHGWRIDLRTARKENPDAMQGQHNVLFLIDEWSGVHKSIYDVIEGAMSDPGSRIFSIGNPIRTQGWGYDAFFKNSKLWHTIHIDTELFTIDKEFETVWVDALGEEHIDVNRGRVDPKENQKWLDISGGNRDALEYRIRVRGEFPLNSANQYIGQALAKKALNRAFYLDEKIEKCHVLGLDPASSGGDDIALVHRHGPNVLDVLTWVEEDTQVLAMQVKDYLRTTGAKYKFKYIAVDAVGEGLGVYDTLRAMHRRKELPNVEYISMYKSSYESPIKEEYDRMRDYAFAMLKKWLVTDDPAFPNHLPKQSQLLVEELSAPGYDFNSRGALKIESKKEMRKRGIKSPNIADALSMTFSQTDAGIAKSLQVDRYNTKYYNNEAPLSWQAV